MARSMHIWERLDSSAHCLAALLLMGMGGCRSSPTPAAIPAAEAPAPAASVREAGRDSARVTMEDLLERTNLGTWTKDGFEVAVSDGELPEYTCDAEWEPDPLPLEWTYAVGRTLYVVTTTTDVVTSQVLAVVDDTRCVQDGTVRVLLDSPAQDRAPRDTQWCAQTVLAFPVPVSATARLRCPISSAPTSMLLARLEEAGVRQKLISMPAYDRKTDEWIEGAPLPQAFDLAASVTVLEVRRQSTTHLVIVSPPDDRLSDEGNGTDLVYVIAEDGALTQLETTDRVRLMVVTDLDGDGHEEVFFEEAYHEGGTVSVLDLRDLAIHRLWSEGM